MISQRTALRPLFISESETVDAVKQNMMQRMIAQAVKAGGGGNSNYTIDITVNGAVGQDVEDLAEAVAEQLTFEIQRREAALA